MGGAVFLSPHLDDAVFSCGGLMLEERKRGTPLDVVTLFAGALPDDRLGPFARDVVRRYGGHQWVKRRREEDRSVLRSIGVRSVHLDFPEALFRTDAGGGALYPSWSALLSGAPRVEDEALIDVLCARIAGLLELRQPTVVYAPLGGGGHVDHVLANRVALELELSGSLGAIRFYEDLPYSAFEPGDPPGYELVHATAIDLVAKMELVRAYILGTAVQDDEAGFFEAFELHARRSSEAGRGHAERYFSKAK